MKVYWDIHYRQRPSSYWVDPNPLAAILRNVKGARRRRLLAQRWHEGNLLEVPTELLNESLPAEAIARLERIDPLFSGGENLPDYLPFETEIARIEIESETIDVISIRARPAKGWIKFRMLNGAGTRFEMSRQNTRQPLTLGEFIEVLETSLCVGASFRLTFEEVRACVRQSPELLRHVPDITSCFYPQLAVHYERFFAERKQEGARD